MSILRDVTVKPLLVSALLLGYGCSDDNNTAPDMPPNRAPGISSIADTTVSANSENVEVSFSVNDDNTANSALVVTVSSDSPETIDNDGITVDGSDQLRNLVITPKPATTGAAVLTVSVTDAAGLTSETSFVLTVVPQQVLFDDIARSAFGANENATPISLNDKELADNAASFNDLLLN